MLGCLLYMIGRPAKTLHEWPTCQTLQLCTLSTSQFRRVPSECFKKLHHTGSYTYKSAHMLYLASRSRYIIVIAAPGPKPGRKAAASQLSYQRHLAGVLWQLRASRLLVLSWFLAQHFLLHLWLFGNLVVREGMCCQRGRRGVHLQSDPVGLGFVQAGREGLALFQVQAGHPGAGQHHLWQLLRLVALQDHRVIQDQGPPAEQVDSHAHRGKADSVTWMTNAFSNTTGPAHMHDKSFSKPHPG